MRTWIWTILLLLAAVVLAVTVRDYSGNVALLLLPYRVELSMSLAVLILLVAFVLLYAVLRFLAWAFDLPARARRWRAGRASNQQQALLERGWINLMAGRYAKAESELSEVADKTGVPARQVLATLCAARAAHAMQEFKRRDALLAQAREASDADASLKPAVSIVAADMLLDQGRPGEALALLSPLHESGPRHLHSLRLSLRAHRDLGHWSEVLKLARMLAKRHALHPAASTRLVAMAAAGQLRTADDTATRRAMWRDLKEEERLLPDVALAGAAMFEAEGDDARARKTLEAALDADMNPALLRAYATCGADQVQPRLAQAELWLRQHPDDADLLQATGALCLCGRLWGPAQRYLERSLEERDDARVHALLASLYDHTGRSLEAVRHWRRVTRGMVGAVGLPDDADAAFHGGARTPPEDDDAAAPDRAAGL